MSALYRCVLVTVAAFRNMYRAFRTVVALFLDWVTCRVNLIFLLRVVPKKLMLAVGVSLVLYPAYRLGGRVLRSVDGRR